MSRFRFDLTRPFGGLHGKVGWKYVSKSDTEYAAQFIRGENIRGVILSTPFPVDIIRKINLIP